jgi:adenylate kinase
MVFLGPPGVGKGTQAAELARELGLAHLSTGDLLRAAVAEGSELGRAADGHMRAGRLVPDELVVEILRERLRRSDAAAGYILDGFPRTIAQAETLGRFARLDVVVSLELDPRILIERLTGRRLCPQCGSVYNLVTRPPREPGRCDRDRTELILRPDDRPEAVQVRLKVYEEQTAPLLDYYRRLGLLRPLDASGTPAEVALRLRRLLSVGSLGASGRASPADDRSR